MKILAYILLSPLALICLGILAILCFLAYTGGWIVWIAIAVIVSTCIGTIILRMEQISKE